MKESNYLTQPVPVQRTVCFLRTIFCFTKKRKETRNIKKKKSKSFFPTFVSQVWNASQYRLVQWLPVVKSRDTSYYFQGILKNHGGYLLKDFYVFCKSEFSEIILNEWTNFLLQAIQGSHSKEVITYKLHMWILTVSEAWSFICGI